MSVHFADDFFEHRHNVDFVTQQACGLRHF